MKETAVSNYQVQVTQHTHNEATYPCVLPMAVEEPAESMATNLLKLH